MDKTFDVGLKRARGSIKEATVEIYQFPEADLLGYDFRAWIEFGGINVEFLQGAIGDRDIRSYYPFGEKETYSYAGDVYAREPLSSFEGWEEFVREYVAGLDPRDVFKYRRQEGL